MYEPKIIVNKFPNGKVQVYIDNKEIESVIGVTIEMSIHRSCISIETYDITELTRTEQRLTKEYPLTNVTLNWNRS